ncbi:MAG: ABC transporter ATP-binding protein [Desulfovibrionales bacterium]|nr:ABC transporter ATP-binding protein [Desulfovibrionales bacterium]
MAHVLTVTALSKSFGGLRALNDVDLHVDAGEIVALIGPNGAGKTTFFNCITGIYEPTDGQVFFTPLKEKERLINGMKPNTVTTLGMARTFQNIRLFKNMTVLENVMVARHCRTKAGIIDALLRPPHMKREEKETIEKSYELLKYIGLHQHYNELACNLPYGAQRRLEIARAMATEPSLLLLDEPAAGMNPQETTSLKELVLDIRDTFGLAILLIEHDMSMVMSLSERIYVMEYGCLIAHGTPQEISTNPQVIKAYLGEESHA